MVLDSTTMRRWFARLVVLTLGCGPSVQTSGSGGADDSGGDTSTGTTGGSQSASSNGSTGVMSEVSTLPDDDDDDGVPPVMIDLAFPDDSGASSDTGAPPLSCELPQQPNSELSGMTPDGARSFTASAFAEAGGGKCPNVLRIVAADDPEALAAVVDGLDRNGFVDVLVIEIVIPDEGLVPGEWSGEMWLGAPHVSSPATAMVTVVPDFDSPAPLLALDVEALDPAWSIVGSVVAHYCGDLIGGVCGA